MKKIISAILAILCTMSLFAACGNENGTAAEAETTISEEANSGNYVIRNVKWGMTIDEVKASETAEFESEKENKSLRYKNIDMFGQKFDLVYAFSVSKGLESASYGSPNVLADEADKLRKSIIDTLTEKYGESEYDSTLNRRTWYSDGTKIDLYEGTPEESVNLTFFRIWYSIDENANQRSDNGNL